MTLSGCSAVDKQYLTVPKKKRVGLKRGLVMPGAGTLFVAAAGVERIDLGPNEYEGRIRISDVEIPYEAIDSKNDIMTRLADEMTDAGWMAALAPDETVEIELNAFGLGPAAVMLTQAARNGVPSRTTITGRSTSKSTRPEETDDA